MDLLIVTTPGQILVHSREHDLLHAAAFFVRTPPQGFGLVF
ncbi:hypothetical protein [Streptosporangium sp. NPDC087985]